MNAQCEEVCRILSNMGLSALAPFLTDLAARVQALEEAPAKVEEPVKKHK